MVDMAGSNVIYFDSPKPMEGFEKISPHATAHYLISKVYVQYQNKPCVSAPYWNSRTYGIASYIYKTVFKCSGRTLWKSIW